MKTCLTLRSTPLGMIRTEMLTMLPLLKFLSLKLMILKYLGLQGMLLKLLMVMWLLLTLEHGTRQNMNTIPENRI